MDVQHPEACIASVWLGYNDRVSSRIELDGSAARVTLDTSTLPSTLLYLEDSLLLRLNIDLLPEPPLCDHG